MKISTLVSYLDYGQITQPSFARTCAWRTPQVLSLLASLYRRYPVGSVILWPTESTAAATGGDGAKMNRSIFLIVDGRQRVSSIYRAFRGQAPVFFDGQDAAIGQVYFNVEREEFGMYRPAMEADPLWVDLAAMFTNGRTGLGAILARQCHGPEGEEAAFCRYLPRLTRLLEITEIDLHTEYLSKDLPLAAAREISILANGGGGHE